MTVTYRVTHRTEYRYESDVTASYGQLHLLPRDLPGQHCRSAEVIVDPAPESYRERVDYFGNRVVLLRHPRAPPRADGDRHQHRRGRRSSPTACRCSGDGRGRRRATRCATGRVPDAARRGAVRARLAAGRGLGDAIASTPPRRSRPGRHLLDARHRRCARGSTRTSPTSRDRRRSPRRLREVFDAARGRLPGLRPRRHRLPALGRAARALRERLPRDRPAARARRSSPGVDGSHAWLSVLVPDAGWLDVDPTNDQLVEQPLRRHRLRPRLQRRPAAERRHLHRGQDREPARAGRCRRAPRLAGCGSRYSCRDARLHLWQLRTAAVLREQPLPALRGTSSASFRHGSTSSSSTGPRGRGCASAQTLCWRNATGCSKTATRAPSAAAAG